MHCMRRGHTLERAVARGLGLLVTVLHELANDARRRISAMLVQTGTSVPFA